MLEQLFLRNLVCLPEIQSKNFMVVFVFMKLAGLTVRLFSTSTAIQESERVTKRLVSIDSIKKLHAHLIRNYLHKEPSSISEVVRSYALSPLYLDKARLVFDQIERPTFLVWNHMIRGLSQSDQPSEAIRTYIRMYHQGLSGNNLTFIFVFKACGRVPDIVRGQMVHVHAQKLGFESYLFVSNALIHMYASCGDLGLAQKAFDRMEDRDLVSWNSLICGFAQHSSFKDVLRVFEAMQSANVKADSVTMVKVILACTYLGDFGIADSVVKYIEERHVGIDVYLGNTMIDMYGRRGLMNLARQVFDRMPERNIVSWNAMLMGYAKVGNLVGARKLFDKMPERDVISWTSMITGYSQAKQYTEAVGLFQDMMAAKVIPDEITVAGVLSACAHSGSLDVGEAVREFVSNHGVKVDIYIGNALIYMYCKCGVVEKGFEVFHEMEIKDPVSWTSIISGLAVNGFADSAVELFSQMLTKGVQPTHGTFVGILLACAHAGLVDKGLEYFESMEKVHGLTPEMKHYGCVVDLLSRSGNLEKAYEFINKMPIIPDVVLWRILLSACKLYGNAALSEIVTNKLLELDPYNSGNYVLSSHTYAGIDRWNDVVKMRTLMDGGNVQKPYGSSSIEVNA